MSPTTPPGPAVSDDPPPRVRPPLRRSHTDRKLGGVAGGLAAYFDIDPLLVRIAFVAVTLSGAGIGGLIYLACLVLIPVEGQDASDARHFVDRHGRGLAIAGGAVVVLALVSASGPFGWGPQHGPWVVLAAGAAVAVFLLARHDRRGAPVADRTASVAATTAAPYATEHPTAPYPRGPYLPAPPAPSPRPPVPPSSRKDRSPLGLLTFGAATLTAGVLVAIGRVDGTSVPTVVVLAAALAVVGLGLVVGAFVGRSHGLIALGVVLAVLTAFAAVVVHLPGNTSAGNQTWAPTAARDVAPLYQWGAGDAVLDLTAVRSATPVSTRVELGAGQIRVLVPGSAVVHLRAEVGAGALVLEDQLGATHTVNGIGRTTTTTLQPLRRAPATTTFDLDLRVGLGQVEVQRATP